MRLVYSSVIALAFISTADAQMITRNCSGHGLTRSCVTIFSSGEGGAQVLKVPGADPLTAQEVEEREARWEKWCEPKLSEPNAYGIRHYIYSKPGCAFGASGPSEN